MTNEDLIKESSLAKDCCTCEKIYTNRKLVAPDCIACNYRDEVIEMMDAARKDEAIAFKKWTDLNFINYQMKDDLYYHKKDLLKHISEATVYTAEQLYEQFKKKQ